MAYGELILRFGWRRAPDFFHELLAHFHGERNGVPFHLAGMEDADKHSSLRAGLVEVAHNVTVGG